MWIPTNTYHQSESSCYRNIHDCYVCYISVIILRYYCPTVGRRCWDSSFSSTIAKAALSGRHHVMYFCLRTRKRIELAKLMYSSSQSRWNQAPNCIVVEWIMVEFAIDCIFLWTGGRENTDQTSSTNPVGTLRLLNPDYNVLLIQCLMLPSYLKIIIATLSIKRNLISHFSF